MSPLVMKVTLACGLLSWVRAARIVLEDVKASVEFGSTVSTRFEMHHVLWRQHLESRKIEHVPLPGVVTKAFTDSKELFAGSFGEAWAATDRKTGKRVVVKMFYTTVGGNRKHITWSAASNDPQLQGQLEDAAGECEVAKDMQQYATTDPTGASRLMQCYEDHVTRGTSLTGHTVTDTQELFQVLEDCGGLPLSKWLEKQVDMGIVEADPDGHVKRSLQLFKQLMEGLNYLTGNAVKWVHHDMKPDNAVVKELGGGNQVLKIIDFGAVTRVSPTAAAQPIVSTVAFAPPEWFPVARGFDAQHPSSFDTYQVGTMLYELITGGMFYEKVAAQSQPPTVFAVQQCVQRQLGYLMAGPQQAQQAEAACIETMSFDAVKGRSGAEFKITGQWGKDRRVRQTTYTETYHPCTDQFGRPAQCVTKTPSTQDIFTPWADAAVSETKNLEAVFFGSVKSQFVGVTNAYLQLAHLKSWQSTFMEIVAFDSGARATPAAVLQTSLLRTVTSTVDPDFNAQEAQKKPRTPSRWHLKPENGHHQPVGGVRGSVQAVAHQPVANNMALPCPDSIQRAYGRHKIWLCVLQANGVYRLIA